MIDSLEHKAGTDDEGPASGTGPGGRTGTGLERCPICLERVHHEAQRCPHCRSWLKANPLQSEWYRGGPDAKIAGVCSGLAMQFPVSVTIIRLAFVLATIFAGGIGLALYIILWFIMPKTAGG